MWTELIPGFQVALNTALKEGPHISPYEIIFGNTDRLPADLHFPRKPLPSPPLPDEYTAKLRKYFRHGHDIARIPLEQLAPWKPAPLFKLGDDVVLALVPVATQ